KTERKPTHAASATAAALGDTSPFPTRSSRAVTIFERLDRLRSRRPSACGACPGTAGEDAVMQSSFPANGSRRKPD
ncbi:hypothetical protein ABTL75_20515, partial [Acinetobacter baumannii]